MSDSNLNKQDVDSLAENVSVENKSLIAHKVGDYYNKKNLSPQAKKTAEDIFRIMVRDTEIRVREALAGSSERDGYSGRKTEEETEPVLF